VGRTTCSVIERPAFAIHSGVMAKSIALLFFRAGRSTSRYGERFIPTVRGGGEPICRGRYGTRVLDQSNCVRRADRGTDKNIALSGGTLRTRNCGAGHSSEQLGNFEFVAAAGLSLGEFTAHAAAGTFDFLTGLRLVANRGRYMEEACNATTGTMAAFIGGEEIEVHKIAQEANVDIANENSPGQIVLSGESENVRHAVDLAKQHGIRRAVLLNVAGAFHSRLMRSAEEKLRSDLATVPMRNTATKVVANVTANPVTGESEIRQSLAKQVTGTVRWTESVEYLIDHLGCDMFLELGPGTVLAGLVGRIRKGTKILSVGDRLSVEAAVAQLRDV